MAGLLIAAVVSGYKARPAEQDVAVLREPRGIQGAEHSHSIPTKKSRLRATFFSRDTRTRTGDPLLPKQVR